MSNPLLNFLNPVIGICKNISKLTNNLHFTAIVLEQTGGKYEEVIFSIVFYCKLAGS